MKIPRKTATVTRSIMKASGCTQKVNGHCVVHISWPFRNENCSRARLIAGRVVADLERSGL